MRILAIFILVVTTGTAQAQESLKFKPLEAKAFENPSILQEAQKNFVQQNASVFHQRLDKSLKSIEEAMKAVSFAAKQEEQCLKDSGELQRRRSTLEALKAQFQASSPADSQRQFLESALQEAQREFDKSLQSEGNLKFAQLERRLACTQLEASCMRFISHLEEFRVATDKIPLYTLRSLIGDSDVKKLHGELRPMLRRAGKFFEEGRGANCDLLTFQQDQWGSLVDRIKEEDLQEQLHNEQRYALLEIRNNVQSLTKMERLHELASGAQKSYNSAVKELSSAGVSGINFTLAVGLKEQLVEAPEIPGERLTPGDWTTIGGGATTIIGILLPFVLPQPPDSMQVGAPSEQLLRDPRFITSGIMLGVGILATQVGQRMQRGELPKAVQTSADRLAINRILGLSLQRMQLSISRTISDFTATPIQEIPSSGGLDLSPPAAPTSEADAYSTILGEFLGRMEKQGTLVLGEGDLGGNSKFGTQYTAWLSKMRSRAEGEREIGMRLDGYMDAATRQSERLSEVLKATDSSLQELRDLVGSERAQRLCADNNLTFKCEGLVDLAKVVDFCNQYTPRGSAHIGAQFLSEEAVKALFELGACNFSRSRQARKAADKAAEELAKAHNNTREYQKAYETVVAESVHKVEKDVEKLRSISLPQTP